ncbi:hypothetical protein AMECASPLE_035482 [Ameca splendens]|uniref:Uncharacterized protein n=1 Tax=Ameca splendens TaxID=208324 RepID=A0ABV0ZG74_9TELE
MAANSISAYKDIRRLGISNKDQKSTNFLLVLLPFFSSSWQGSCRCTHCRHLLDWNVEWLRAFFFLFFTKKPRAQGQVRPSRSEEDQEQVTWSESDQQQQT